MCWPLHRNPQSLPLTTRNSYEAKPYCLLKPRINFFLFPTYDLIKSRQHVSCNKDIFQILYTQIYTFLNMATSNILSIEPRAQYIFTKLYYVHTYAPLHKFKVFPYKIFLITTLIQMSGESYSTPASVVPLPGK